MLHNDSIYCPRCKAVELWKFGRDPDTGKQKYRCKKCLHQFVPGQQRVLKHPVLYCPKCGARMWIFARQADTVRYRCSRYNRPPGQRCMHKINLNHDGTRQFTLITEPQKIELVAGRIDSVFRWNRMRFGKHVVVLAVYYAICETMPATQVARTMRNIHHVRISHDTVTRWHHKAAFLFSARLSKSTKFPLKRVENHGYTPTRPNARCVEKSAGFGSATAESMTSCSAGI